MRTIASAAVLIAVCITASAAQRLQPSQDVTVSYRVAGPATEFVPGGISRPIRLMWEAAGKRVRIEAEGRPQVVLFDLSKHDGIVMDTTARVILPLRLRAQDLQPLTLENARLSAPRGQARGAGLPCTVYRIESGWGGSVCLTADGVPLRGEGEVHGRAGRFEAIAVQYGPVSSALFEPPSGYILLGGKGQGGLSGLANRLGLGTLGRAPP